MYHVETKYWCIVNCIWNQCLTCLQLHQQIMSGSVIPIQRLTLSNIPDNIHNIILFQKFKISSRNKTIFFLQPGSSFLINIVHLECTRIFFCVTSFLSSSSFSINIFRLRRNALRQEKWIRLNYIFTPLFRLILPLSNWKLIKYFLHIHIFVDELVYLRKELIID